MKKVVLSILAVLVFIQPSSAQSRRETKMYDRAVSANTVEAFDQFIKKYPQSVFRPVIDSLRYEMLYVSRMSNMEALEIITALDSSLISGQDEPETFKAVAFRDEGRDFIVGVRVPGMGAPSDSLGFCVSEKIGGVWQLPVTKNFPKNCSSEDMVFSVLTGDENVVVLNGEKWLHYSYRNFSRGGIKQEQVESLLPLGSYVIDNQAPASVDVMFCGNRLDSRRIEGYFVTDTTRMEKDELYRFLCGRLNSNETLVQIAEEDLLTDRAVEWWLNNNPTAQTTAKTIKFGVLPEDCSIVSSFKSSREKDGNAGWTAALFDIRGYTVVCARTPSGEYSLVWCEPRFKDRSSDRILNTVYFEKGSTLALFYYQGRRAFKYKLNLSNKNITR